MSLKEIGCEDVEWIEVAQDDIQCRDSTRQCASSRSLGCREFCF
jgi:hypothetical protein